MPTTPHLEAKRPVTPLAGPYGHPFHPILVTAPIGASVVSLVFDVTSRWAGEAEVFVKGSFWLIGVGSSRRGTPARRQAALPARCRSASMGGLGREEAAMDDETIVRRISALAGEEHELERSHAGDGLDEDELARLRAIEVALDQCWDLLRQRRARRASGLDPDDATVRPEGVVEGYQQ
jgi:hypothetical protein